MQWQPPLVYKALPPPARGQTHLLTHSNNIWTHIVTLIGNKSMESIELAISSLQLASHLFGPKTDKKCWWQSLWSWKNPEHSHTIDHHGRMEDKALDRIEVWNSGGTNWCRDQLGCRVEKSRISALHASLPEHTEDWSWGALYREMDKLIKCNIVREFGTWWIWWCWPKWEWKQKNITERTLSY